MASDPVALNSIVLVADAAEEARYVVTDALEYLRAHIVHAANVYEVYEYAARGGVSLVLTDLQMPGGSIDYISELRRHLPHCPILVVTALEGTPTTQAIADGASAYMKKPFRIRQLRAVVEELLATPGVSTRPAPLQVEKRELRLETDNGAL